MANNVLFEIGLEELPARFIDDAEAQLLNRTKKWLDDSRLAYESINTFSTPRRLSVLIKGIADEQLTIEEEVRGPSNKIAKDAEGNWSKAALGFTKGQGKSVEDIYMKEIKGTDYIFVKKHIEGKQTIDILPSFKEIIKSIDFNQTMRWANETMRYARPIRWLVALCNDKIIPFEMAHVKSGNKTNGHRFLGEEIVITNPLEYERLLDDNFVIADKEKREQIIVQGIKELEEQEAFSIDVDPDLLTEVRNLVEYPTVFFGEFEEEFLQLPAEVLITSMKEHQRYFPVKDKNNHLLPYFVGVRNGDEHAIDTVVRGNEKVLRARLADGQFFFEEDLKQTIEENLEKLTRVVFQEKLGTVSEKVNRIKNSTKQLANLLGIDQAIVSQATRAAEISKFDLMTNMVNEFTELQGIMGEKYAKHFGEEDKVAVAIREHYLPYQSYGTLPETLQGALVSVADKLDTIIGFISVGLTPTGSQDPYSLRRQALGVLRILEERKWQIPFEAILEIAQSQYDLNNREDIIAHINEFFKLRASFLLREKGIEQDVIDAVMQTKIGVFSYTIDKASLLSEKRNDPNFKEIEEALVRVLNISKDKEDLIVDPSLFATSSEKLLFKAYTDIKSKYEIAKKQQEALETLNSLSQLASPIHDFFDNNMVMAEDLNLRKNRLALVNNLAVLIEDYADLTVIQWKQHV